ncbi:MAG: sulfate transporter [Legionella sp.]|nr:MAG: sulfate transporter [Legionella sp.]PJD99593.1 MAG: sulfate transporter [Legionella sp.]
MNPFLFKPSTHLTFDTVASVRKAVYKQVVTHADSAFVLDLSEVVHCDSAGLALLIEVKKLCRQQGKSLNVVGVSSNIHALAEFCGVNDILKTNQA